MNKLLITVAYDGTAYCGYQVQPNGTSIQQRLNEASEALFGFPCDIVGCSRTDSGVHAHAFCATVVKKGSDTLPTTIPVERIPLALSAHLPIDIAVREARWVSSEFHARYDVKEKEYVYRIYNAPVRSPFEEGRAAHIPKLIDEMALERMNQAAKTWIGTQDFAAYMAQGSKITDTVRTVTDAYVVREGDVLCFHVAADGFLYHMVRILAGTLLAVAEGKLTPAEVCAVTASRDRARAGITMPACGLYLHRVIYR